MFCFPIKIGGGSINTRTNRSAEGGISKQHAAAMEMEMAATLSGWVAYQICNLERRKYSQQNNNSFYDQINSAIPSDTCSTVCHSTIYSFSCIM